MKSSFISGAIADEIKPNVLLGSFFVLFGFSFANALGGIWQAIFLFFLFFASVITSAKSSVVQIVLLLSAVTIGSIVSIFNHANMAPFVLLLRPFAEGYLLATFLYYACNVRDKYSILAILSYFLIVQMIFALIMLANHELRLSLINAWYSSESFQGDAIQGALLFRGYGVSLHHLYGFPLATGTITFLLLALDSHGHSVRKFIGIISGILLTLINARVGLVPIFIYFILISTLFLSVPNFKILLRVIIVILCVFLFATYTNFFSEFKTIIDWLVEGTEQFTGKNSGGSTTLSDLNSMIYLPTSVTELTIGLGDVCHKNSGCYSDIGFVRLLQRGGILLLIPIVLFYFNVLYKISVLFSDSKKEKYLLMICLITTFIVATIKFDSYAASDYSRLLITISSLAVLLPTKNRRCYV